MNPERWKLIKELHARALELRQEERVGFLTSECAGDEELLREVVALLDVEYAEQFLEAPEEGSVRQVGPGTKLGDFELFEKVGEGGMGVVFRARQISLDREVAVKILPSLASLEPRQVERFKREAHAAARLHHHAIVPVHSVGEERGTHYFAMEYVKGRSLHEELEILRAQTKANGAEEPILPRYHSREFIASVARIAAEVGAALHYAHGAGVVHRDVKPQNLLLDLAGNPHVVDFGLAKVEELVSISRFGEIAGTVFYMSPEQALAKRVRIDHRTDIFSLGVVLYEMLTLRRAFQGTTSPEVLYNISFSEPPSIRKINPRVPRDLETICQKAYAKKPDDRYATAGELADDLQRFLGHEAIHAKRPSPVSRMLSHVSRRRHWYLPGVAVSVVIVLGLSLAPRWIEDRVIQAKLRPLKAIVEAEDLTDWNITVLVRGLREALLFREEGLAPSLMAEWGEPALERIRVVGSDRKREGLRRLRLGLAPPKDTPREEYLGASDPDYFAGLRLLQEAKLLLPSDEEVAHWADPRNTYPKLEIVSDSTLDGAEVFTRSINWFTYEIGPPEFRGELPLDERIPIEPGAYRITVVTEEGYCELTRVLYQRGRLYSVRPSVRETSSVASGMVRIPAGEYPVGDPYTERFPQFRARKIHMSSFLIDATEVTNAEYRVFVEATGSPEPRFWKGKYEEAWDDLPVIGVELRWAQSYAEWVGKRLPTYHEWEVAARGPNGLHYPWGDEDVSVEEYSVVGRPSAGRQIWASYLSGIRPVGSTPGDVSPFGLFDTLGNVREWTETIHPTLTRDGEPYPDFGAHVAKGNTWDTGTNLLGPLFMSAACPVLGREKIGFRCAKSVLSQ